jgi:molybdopterin converting factor small subunit
MVGERLQLHSQFDKSPPLRVLAGGRSHIGSPPTPLDALDELWKQYPGIRDRVLTEEGQVREHINIFVGQENVRCTGNFATRLPAEAVISIIPAVSGGRCPSC